MQGLELSRKYYESFGKQMIHDKFPEYESRIAVGLAGPGSDCFGFDDETSRDHDFGAGFCIWLTDEDYELFGHRLAREYCNLPDSVDGFDKTYVPPYGTHRYGVQRISDFFRPLTGLDGAPETIQQWLYTPEYSLACAVNGEVFRDDSGHFTEIRNRIELDMPEDVRLKKIAARTILMAQSGQYNFMRCVNHGEFGAAALAVSEFVRNAASLVYTLNGRYCPFYKWAIKGIRMLNEFSYTADIFDNILTGDIAHNSDSVFSSIETVCGDFADYFRETGMSGSSGVFLEPHAYSIQNKIKDSGLRQMHIMEG